MAGACNLSYSGGWDRRIAWTQEVEIAVRQDHAIALQPEQQSEVLSIYIYIYIYIFLDIYYASHIYVYILS